MSGGGGGSNDGGAKKREAARLKRIDEGTAAVNSIFGQGNDEAAAKRQAMYDTTRNDTRQFYSEQLGEDSAKAKRDLEFQKARQGIIGSSQSNDLDSEYQKRMDRGLIDVANRADSTATQFKTSDETARLNLIAKVVAGLDQGSAAQNAISTMQTNANAAKEAYQSQRMANVFSDLLGSYNNAQYNAGTNAAKQQYGSETGNFHANNSPYSGNTSIG